MWQYHDMTKIRALGAGQHCVVILLGLSEEEGSVPPVRS